MNRFTKLTVLATASALWLTGCGIASSVTPTPSKTTPRGDVDAMLTCLINAVNSVGQGTSGNTSSTVTPSIGFASNAKVGIALPQKTSQNWVEAEPMFDKALAEAGFGSIVQFGTNGVEDQQNQITDMIAQGISVLVVSAVDGSQLGSQLDAAKAAGITVIAYDRLLTKTDSVDLYVAYDNYKVGQFQGQAVLQGMMTTQGDPPYNIELIAGSPDDANSQPFFDGAMSVLQPGLDCGALKILSGENTETQVATQGWLASNAQARMDGILADYYTDATLNGILSPNDALARAALASLSHAGKSDDKTVISGQDSEIASIPLIMQGTQYMTIYKSTQGLVNEIVKIVKLLQQGQPVPVNDISTYDNGNKVVPTDLLTPQVVTAANAADVYKDDPARQPCTQLPTPSTCQL